MHKQKGLPTSGGIAIAQIHHLYETPTLVLEKQGKGIRFELNRLNSALATAKDELNTLALHAKTRVGEEQASIFSAQSLMLADPMILELAAKKIETESLNAAYAFRTTISEMVDLFEASENLYIKERIIDLKDITKRVLHILSGSKEQTELINKDIILVAEDLMPSLTISLDTKFIKGIVTQSGSKTSHSAILARHLGIPAISGVDVAKLSENTLAIIDGSTGDIITNPNDEVVQSYQQKQSEIIKRKIVYNALKNKDGVTLDGKGVVISANIGNIQDLENAHLEGAKGIGLLRTETQYMELDDFPTEEDLVSFYKAVTTAFKNGKVVARTLDIGGDKDLPYLNNRNELNPFLGNRAIRYSLTYPGLFKTQLRALLQAGSHQNLSIMFPMISTIDELRDAKKILDEAKTSLEEEFFDVETPKVGIMIEVPSAALFVDRLAKEVDFVSIGTNDLIQYLFAADRMNEKVSNLYQPYHPVVLKVIKQVVDAAHKHGVTVSVCGEMAGHPKQALLLVGLGVDELSMNANSIAETKYLISKSNYKDLKDLTNQALDLETNDQVHQLIDTYTKKLDL